MFGMLGRTVSARMMVEPDRWADGNATWEAISFRSRHDGDRADRAIVIIAPSLVVLIVSSPTASHSNSRRPVIRRGGTPEVWMRWQCISPRRTVSLSRCGRLGCRSCSALPQHWRLHARLTYRHAYWTRCVHVAAGASALAFGLSALMLFSLVGLPVSPLTLVIGHTVVCVPYVVRNTVARTAERPCWKVPPFSAPAAWYFFDGSYCA
mgnify:CR=1 FL=1